MGTTFKVESVKDVNEWGEANRRMVTWTLDVSSPSGPQTIQIRSKPGGNQYKAGDTFYAEVTDKPPYKGMQTWKRAQSPEGGNQAPMPPNPPQSVSNRLPEAPRAIPAMPYEQATAIAGVVSKDFGGDTLLSAAMLRAVLEGLVASPIKPQTQVSYFGKTLDTAGIEQAAWDELDLLVKQLAKETDEKSVKALLIAECGVASRKDLTADKAKIFIQTIKDNLATIEASKIPPAESEVPF